MKSEITKPDIRRDGLTIKKLIQLLKLFLPKNSKTLARLKRFTDLDLKKINQLRNLNVKGIILDIDDCIAPNRQKILQQNLEHIKKLHSQGFKILLYSNRKHSERVEDIDKYADFLYTKYPKPDENGFKEALKKLGLKKEEVVMVGDNLITDGGAIQYGIAFILIKPIKSENKKLIYKIIMPPYAWLRNFYNSLSAFYDTFRKEKPLKSKDGGRQSRG